MAQYSKNVGPRGQATVTNEFSEAKKSTYVSDCDRIKTINKIGVRIQIMFWIRIILILISVVSSIVKNTKIAGGPVLVLTLATFVLDLIYGIVQIILNDYVEGFRTSGILFIIVSVITFMQAFFDGFGMTVLTIGGAIASFVAIYMFIMNMSICASVVDRSLSMSWDSLVKNYTIGFLLLGGAIVLALVPLFGILPVLALLAGLVFLIVAGIRELVLLHETSQTFLYYKPASQSHK